MTSIFEFCRSAFPWIAIGLLTAVVFASKDKEGHERFPSWLAYTPLVCFLIVAALELVDGHTSQAVTWVILGVFNGYYCYKQNNNPND